MYVVRSTAYWIGESWQCPDYSSDVVKYFGQILFFHRAPFTFSMKDDVNDDVCVSSSHIRGIVYQSDKSKTSSNVWKSVLHISLISVTRFHGFGYVLFISRGSRPSLLICRPRCGLLSFVRFAHVAKSPCVSMGISYIGNADVFRAPKVQFIEPRKAGRLLRWPRNKNKQ